MTADGFLPPEDDDPGAIIGMLVTILFILGSLFVCWLNAACS